MLKSMIIGMSAVCLPLLGQSAMGAECANPSALSVSRVIAVSPSDFPLIGKLGYRESLPLNDREVVLTFADGPAAPYTSTILDALSAECVKATFFVTGNAVQDSGDILRREINDEHTIGTHTFSGESIIDLPIEKAREEIDKGITAAIEAAGNRESIAPFFRAPDLEMSKAAERYVLSKGLTVWSGDVDSNDWDLTVEDEFVSKTIAELEKSKKGILLLHDAQPVTARGIKQLLVELKARKFKIVHVKFNKRTITTGSVR